MPRIRTIKPDIRRSLTVSAWPYPVRWTFVGLPGYCDDYGRGIDDARLIKAELYPLDDDMTARKLETHLGRIAGAKEHGAPPLCRYEVRGFRYLHLVGWSEHQRVSHPTPSRIPPCPEHEMDEDSPEGIPKESGGLPKESESLPSSRAPAEQGTGNRDKEQGSSSAVNGGALVKAWIDGCQKRPPDRVVGQVAKIVGGLLDEGYEPDVIHVALSELRAKALHPSTLPSILNGVLNPPTVNGQRGDPLATIARNLARLERDSDDRPRNGANPRLAINP